MNCQYLNLKNSSILSEGELVMLLGGGVGLNEMITEPDTNNDKCNNCDKCDKCVCI